MNTTHGWIAGALASIMLSTAAAAQAPRQDAEIWRYLAELPKEERLAVLEEEAKREGQLVLYGVLGIDRAQLFFEIFAERYPDIQTEHVRLTSDVLADRLLLEQQTGSVNGDVVISSVPYLELHTEALAPYEPTTWDSFDERFRHGGFEEGWTAMSYEVLPDGIAWRTDRVSDEEAPRSLEEVADPKWTGRVGTTTQLERFIDMMIETFGEEEAMERVEKLAALENRNYRSIAALRDAIGAGEIDIAWGLGPYRAEPLKREGAPVDWVFSEPLFGLGVTVSVIANAEHPYAAALFMEVLTEADTLERLDKLEPGRLFGHEEGTYDLSVQDLPSLQLYRSIPEDRFRDLNRTVEQLFLR